MLAQLSALIHVWLLGAVEEAAGLLRLDIATQIASDAQPCCWLKSQPFCSL